jgi:predicted O-linked N-acetylglucosamine transferase (SPINDLY family)
MESGYQIFMEKNLPELTTSPYKTNGYITYGSFNCSSKFSDATLFIWSQLLKKNTTAKLLIYRSQLTKNVIRSLKAKFAKLGIDEERLIFDSKALSPHYKAYLKADIALDPYPFSGMSIAIESASMGVPTITLVGEGMQSRGAGRINSLIGLDELNATSGEEYIKKALELAADKEKISMLRQTLRTKVNNSDIRVNEKEFTQDLEAKFKKVWQDFINSP